MAAWAALAAIMGALSGLGILKDIAAEGHLSSMYLWCSLAASVVLAVALTLLFNVAHVQQLEIEGLSHQNDLDHQERDDLSRSAATLIHRMTEEVRRVSYDSDEWEGWDNSRLHKILDGHLRRYVRQLLRAPKLDVRTTVKRATSEAVIKLYRCSNQPDARALRDRVSWEQSAPMRRFKESRDEKHAQQRQWVHIPAVERDPGVSSTYKDDLAKLQISSILAFPLRAPAVELPGGSRFGPLLGFISLDCKEPSVFTPLFDGGDEEARGRLEVFFALADALATILVLMNLPRREPEPNV